MPTIFLDEAGYTGQNLLDSEQPVFTLSSLCCSEEFCEELKQKFFGKVKANELKYSSLTKRYSGQQMLLKFFSEFQKHPELVKLSIYQKKYSLLTKIIDLLTEPAMYLNGIDLFDRGGNIVLSNLLYTILPVIEGEAFFEEVLKLFQKMMLSRSLFDYTVFFGTVMGHSYRDPQLRSLVAGGIGGAYNNFGLKILNLPSHSLDLAVTGTFTLAALWRKDIADGEGINLIHDNSSAMAREKIIWDTLTDPEISPQVLGYDIRTLQLPIAVTKTSAEDSKNWAGLQLADLFAGGMAESAKWILTNENPKNGYAEELTTILNSDSFQKHSVWASDEIIPEALGTVGTNAASFDELAKILKNKLEK